MRCYCCSVKKKLLESFAALKTDNGEVYLCSDCYSLLYNIRDSFNNKNAKRNRKYIKELQERKSTPQEDYKKWEDDFLKSYKL